ncbi:MAG: class I SAM-dependent methyltransferase [Candidatus Magasanikbacteria bacterium]|nr:class I SAM-dependent methyltransferase [Candidatus Magasanikbacteria bacterium]
MKKNQMKKFRKGERNALGMTADQSSVIRNTAWEKSSRWYDKLVGEGGHYYHEHVILPAVLAIFKLQNGDSVLDIGSGQGVLARILPRGISYVGVDASLSLTKVASAKNKNPEHRYVCADAGKTLPVAKKDFTHAAIILALQNMENPGSVLKNTAVHLKGGAKLVIVLNHPAFRIPRQSGWDVNPKNNIQYRWINRYLSPMKIPLNMHPGKSNTELTWSFHEPISAYAKFLKEAGFVIENIEEWSSDKTSTSREKKREDRARAEIPLFMCVVAIKK